ncbi:MAG: hypothetical protein CVU24_09655 [Betaproteobacteria bacterium HGW-Betaproteobacteria-18]|nr:MAG: hypothetical protein CVU24_09655 [Betaproteobacteria bacterium HGW-Betaproteobacteria-18]
MTISISKKSQLYGVLIGQMMGMKDIQSDLVPKGKITISKQQYITRLGYYPSDKKRKIADLEIGSTKSGHMYFKLVLYPSKFQSKEFSKFKDHLETLFQIPYDVMFYTAKVAYIELAVDSLTHQFHTFIPFRQKINWSKGWPEEGEKNTMYLGSKLSKKRFCIYNKAKHLTDSKCAGKHKIRTRFEARLRHIGMAASEITEHLPNPFSCLEIADLPKARALSADLQWQSFLDQCLEVGSASSLKQCQKLIRKKYMTMLRDVAVTWWNPDYLWQVLPTALEVIAP